ncbi:GtrA family protein [Niallia sp. 01092]|uniref:GtrA family protein n=1 Tax=unclassified Niallia TaxID=2837522 RepID=UPI003FD1A2FA
MLQHPFIKFLFIGVINTLVGLSITYTCLSFLQLNYWTSTIIGNCLGACVSYFLNKRFTFQSKAPFMGSSIRFAIVIILSYISAYKIGLEIVEEIVKMLAIPAGYTEEIAVLFGSGLYTILNYLGQKYIVFPHKYKQEPRS